MKKLAKLVFQKLGSTLSPKKVFMDSNLEAIDNLLFNFDFNELSTQQSISLFMEVEERFKLKIIQKAHFATAEIEAINEFLC
jgi:hypothetical protein